MFPTRHEILAAFHNPELTQHAMHPPGVRTFACLNDWNNRAVIELPKLHLDISGIDYLEYSTPPAEMRRPPLQLHFQQDCFRLWFQVDGSGILHNLSRNSFGTARPGLLGIMERSQRYSYLHQKGTLECFQVFFSLLPSQNARCYWNSSIEGKCVLEGTERAYFENLVFDLLCVRSNQKEVWGLSTTSRLLEIFVVLFNKGLLVIEEAQFPKNKAKSLVAKAKMFMELQYARMRHQRELEKECSVDINYLNIIFKKETGQTLYDYLTNIRMEQAKHLLETTTDPVTDIASRVGYPSGNSFTRAFTRREKCPPLNYRRKFHDKRVA
ncbi:MAG: helix-turn-helix transcriptional regulator [Chitinispirillaceae bacterium]|jgi:AraC-like DNA-binding protein